MMMGSPHPESGSSRPSLGQSSNLSIGSWWLLCQARNAEREFLRGSQLVEHRPTPTEMERDGTGETFYVKLLEELGEREILVGRHYFRGCHHPGDLRKRRADPLMITAAQAQLP